MCKKSVSVWVKGGKAWSLRSDTKSKKNSDLAVVSVCVCVCLPCGFGVLAESRVCHEVWCVSLCGCKVALVGGVYVGWVLLAVQSSVEVCGW